jgi:hypothetical protein
MSQTLVTLATYTYATEAYVLLAKLKAEGITPVLKNEHLIATQQFLSNAVGGLDVQVDQKDLERAKVILNTMEQERVAAERPPEWLTKDFEKVLTYCPECESGNVYRKKGGFFSLGSALHVCSDCHHSWKQ